MKKKQSEGFTLIELLMVIAIIAVLVSLLLSAIFKVKAWADVSTTQNTLKMVRDAIVGYKGDTGQFPLMDRTAHVGGSTSAKAGTWIYQLQTQGSDAPYIKDTADVLELDADNGTAEVLDAWGTPIKFRVVGKHGSGNDGIKKDDYLKVSNLLGVFYVWSTGPDQLDEFEDMYDTVSSGGWDIDLGKASNWQVFEGIDDAIWTEEVEDDVIISGQVK